MEGPEPGTPPDLQSNAPPTRQYNDRRRRRTFGPKPQQQGMDPPVPAQNVAQPPQSSSHHTRDAPSHQPQRYNQRRPPHRWHPAGKQQVRDDQQTTGTHWRHSPPPRNLDAENPHSFKEDPRGAKKENFRKKKPQIRPGDEEDLTQVLTKQFFFASPYEKYQPRPIKRFQHQTPKYNKEQFLLASCQFIVSANAAWLMDVRATDQMIDWSYVEEVRVGMYFNETVVCPICLYPPVAAKITRCGHVFCWPCILHYLSLAEKNWIKCPICYEHVRQGDLKTAAYTYFQPIKVGDTLNLCLMRRHRHSTLIEPASAWKPGLEGVLGGVETMHYQKILAASKDEILDIVSKEESELNLLLEKERDTAEACFIEAALELACERRKRVMCEEEKSRATNLPCSSNPDQHTSEEYNYFYQAQDGQYIFLHWLNVRMLLHEYGNWEGGPPQIAGKVLELEYHSMTKELRNQLRYLKHLPLSTCFTVAELQLENLILSPGTLDLFQRDVKNRKLMRTKKAKNQKREEKEIEKRCKNLGGPVSGEARTSSHSLPALESFEFPSLLQEEPSVLEPPQISFAGMLKNLPAEEDVLPTSSILEFPSLVQDEPPHSLELPPSSSSQENAQPSFSEILKSLKGNHSREPLPFQESFEGEVVPATLTLADCMINLHKVKKRTKNKKH